MTRAEDYEKAHALKIAWSYAQHFGGLDHMIGVLWVVKNRSDAGWGSVLHVLDTMERWEAAPAPTKTHPDKWDRRFVSLMHAIDGIFDHTAKDITNGGLWFADLTNVSNDWFLTNVCRSKDKQRCADVSSWTYWKAVTGDEILSPVSIAY